jgi:uncharacterized protein (TIGR03435 family)
MTHARIMLAGGVAALVAALCGHPVAQAPPRRAFDVASIKPNASAQDGGTLIVRTGVFRAVNMTLRSLIAAAFGDGQTLFNDQLIGGPSWIASDRFDITANTEVGGPQDLKQLPPFVQALLEDRFGLETHREKRQLPIYVLVVTHADGTLGPQLRPSLIDCAARSRLSSTAGPQVASAPNPVPRPACGVRIGPGTLSAGGLTVPTLIRMLSSTLERIVLDRTKLSGTFDVELQWAPDRTTLGDTVGASPLDVRPSIFTAVQEQLGLRLESTKEAIDVVVIDHAERPEPD